jgi:hypothetical protein
VDAGATVTTATVDVQPELSRAAAELLPLQQQYIDGLLAHCAALNLTGALLGVDDGNVGNKTYTWAPAADGSVQLVVILFAIGHWPPRFWGMMFERALQPHVKGRVNVVMTKDTSLMCQPATLTMSLVGQFFSEQKYPFPTFAPVVYARYDQRQPRVRRRLRCVSFA